MAKKKVIYDESTIQTLSALEHIRKRTGMYIGSIGDGSQYDDGIYILLKEVVDNAVDEFISGYGKKVEITVEPRFVRVRDYGRGIPLGKVLECVSQINTGAKYNDDVFQFSVGLNGVGTKAVNALSSEFLVKSFRSGKFAGGRFERGKLKEELGGACRGEKDGTLIEFVPDPDIFGASEFQPELVERRLRLYSYVQAGLELVYNGESIVSENGLVDLVEAETGDDAIYTPLAYRSPSAGGGQGAEDENGKLVAGLEIAFTHTPRFSETFYSFVNGQYTSDGGTHLSAFREGFIKGVNEFAKAKYDGDDARESMVGAISIRMKSPAFEGQTKNKLGSPEIRSELVAEIRDIVADLLHRNPETAKALITKIEETQSLRKELQTVKKLSRERSKAVARHIPQLRDCKSHLDPKHKRGRDSMIFLTEGLSAAGSITKTRDVRTQAVFTLRGKPLNVAELQRAAIYTNEELYNLMSALNIEDSTAGLRYEKIVFATDADVDGMHIRNLLLTFFLKFFPSLATTGHVFILETPLFRVRNKKETRYCYSEAERDAAMKALKGPEVTRFKGLGEINPDEFVHFIGPKMRLTQVKVGNEARVPPVLTFYMGHNTPERRQFIMEHLEVDPEF
ncbi:MAG: type IIA DNA topoisomerase subunit B [Kiritimatiellae bacterium]|nr:type IIA DNA topoisomerase subunit B [Kiritimatiellia bacterium]